MQSARFLWGVTFILTGILWFATMFGYVPVSVWGRLLPMWPLLIVFVGLRIILKDGKAYASFGLFILLSVFAYAVYSPFSIGELVGINEVINTQITTIPKVSADKRVIVNINAGATEIVVKSLSSESSKTSVLSTTSEGIKDLAVTKRADNNGTVIIDVSEDIDRGIYLTQAVKRKVTLEVARNIPIEFVISAGATSSKMDFSGLRLVSLTLKSGATSSDIKIGNLENQVRVHIQSGASDYKISMPQSSAYKVVSRSGLTNVVYPSNKDFVVDGDTRRSLDYTPTNKLVDIDLESGLTNVNIQTY